VEATVLMLADDAAAIGGKLYVHGGGWDTIHTPAMPATIARIALVLTVQVEYDEALRDQPLRIDLVDEDDQPQGDVRAEGVLRVGHPPDSRPGEPTFVSQALRFESVRFDHAGRYRFRVFLGEAETPLASLPFRLSVLHPPTPR
jgi:hypothetical protein